MNFILKLKPLQEDSPPPLLPQSISPIRYKPLPGGCTLDETLPFLPLPLCKILKEAARLQPDGVCIG